MLSIVSFGPHVIITVRPFLPEAKLSFRSKKLLRDEILAIHIIGANDGVRIQFVPGVKTFSVEYFAHYMYLHSVFLKSEWKWAEHDYAQGLNAVHGFESIILLLHK
jgi:hypothetical protein